MRSGGTAAFSLALVLATLAPGLGPDRTASEKEQKVIAAGKLKVAGRSMRCGRTPTLISRRFWDYGGATNGLIILNPRKLATIPKAVRFYVYAHECGHQIYGATEIKADCYAVRRGRRAGWLTRRGLGQICHFFRNHQGDYVHPPGPERCRLMTRCFNGAKPRRAGRRRRG